MPLKVVLAVGVDSWMLAANTAVWRSAGFIVLSATTIREAFDHFRSGDFDLVLLGNALPVETKERLTYLVRSSGSRTPVLSIADSSGNSDTFASATVSNDASSMLQSMGELMAAESKLHFTQSLHFGAA
jgi:DNA-binding response OmpR family regulator